MASTADCIKAINNEDISRFSKLINSGKNEWKRVNKFKYKDGIRRYFYLTDSCLLATVDDIHGALTIVVRPPMLWESYMIADLRPNDDFAHDDMQDLLEDHDFFCLQESAKHSEPEQYYFRMGNDDGGWIFFGPKKCDDYDQHICGWIDHLLPHSLRNNEVMECTYAPVYDSLKQELIDLGFDFRA